MKFWLGHIDLLLFALVCAGIPVLAISSWIRHLAQRQNETPGRRRVRWILTGLLSVEMICGLYGFLVEPRWLDLTRHRHVIPGLQGALRVIHLSDLHLDGDRGWQAEILEAVTSADPDLVVLTGDYLNAPVHAAELRDFLSHLVGLVGHQRIFAVTGNFGLIDGPQEVFADSGVGLLDGVLVTVTRRGASVQLAGIGYHRQEISEQILADLAAQVEPSVPALLLYHTPDLAESSGMEKFDFVFCGHTHGGQVRLPFYGALITLSRFGKRYEAGLYRLNQKTRMYVSRGLGLEPAPAPQVRFLCRPELAVFDFTGGSRAEPKR